MTSNANAFGDVTFICKYDGDFDKELYEIKGKKVYRDGTLVTGIKNLSYFINKLEWTEVSDGLYYSLSDHHTGKITDVFKVNFSTNKMVEITTTENGWWRNGRADKNPITDFGVCEKM